MNAKITQENIQNLLELFAKTSYEAGSCEPGTIEYEVTKKCKELFQLDFHLHILNNTNGVLSPYYPSQIMIPVKQTKEGFNSFGSISSETINEQQEFINDNGTNKSLKEYISMAKYARCRQRFAIPVMLYKGKFICRSATISIRPETYGRKVVDFAYDCIYSGNNPDTPMDTDANNSNISNNTSDISNTISETTIHDEMIKTLMPAVTETSQFSYHEVIKSDIQLLEKLNVKTILDLMVENRKMKYFVPMTSSEKADPENRYKDFNLLSLPYPGCEFFSKFRDNNYMAKNLYYNWSRNFIDAELNVPKNVLNEHNIDVNDINWSEYKTWDIVLITQNYLKTILKFIEYENSGMLIHCISGWDRTPLFISLIRLSLWADGLIHQSLTPVQMAYFTLAYDWYLFGHQLPTRLLGGEEILFFCFHVLKHITEDEFSIADFRKRSKTSSSSGSSSSVIVLKHDHCDDDPGNSSGSKDDCVLVQNIDQDSNDSFSFCDMSSNENFTLSCRSPSSKRSKTSPISVPGLSACRQRQESTSSNGSWQVVTETGSIDSVMNCRGEFNNGGANLDLNRDNSTKTTSSLRKQRLNAVRTIFIQAYGKTIGLKFKEGSSINLVNFIGTITEQLF